MLISVKDAAKKTGMSESQIRRMIREKLLKARKIGAFYVIREIDVSRIERRRSPNGTRQK